MSQLGAQLDFFLNLANCRFHVKANPVDLARVNVRFGAYQCAPGETEPRDASLAVDVHSKYGAEFAQPEGLEYPGCSGDALADGTILFTRLGFEMRYRPNARYAECRSEPTNPRAPADADATPIDTPLRILLSYILPEREGLVLHASGYGDARGAVVFAGVSGAGKTTTAKKLPVDQVLSDDQIALLRTAKGWTAHALPFVGEYNRPTIPRVVPLRKILLLEKGDSPTTIVPSGGAAQCVQLMGCAPWYVRGDPRAARLFDLVHDLVSRGLVARVRVSRDEPIMPLVEKILACHSG